MSMGTVPSRKSSRASTATGVTNATTVPSNVTTVPSNVTAVPSNVTAVSDATASVATGVSKATEASGAASSVATGVSMATDVSKVSEGKVAESSVASGVSRATAASDDLAMTLTGASLVGSGKWTNDHSSERPELSPLSTITSYGRPFGCSLMCTDIYSQCYFVHWHLQQCLIQSSSLAKRNAIFIDKTSNKPE